MKNRIGSSLDRATVLLRAAETGTPRLDAEVLMAYLLQKRRAWLLAHPEQGLDETESAQFFEWIDERARGMPIAYLTGEREFWSLRLQVTPEVLIPRPETELLVEQGLDLLSMGAVRVLDLGTGSGAIALALAKARPDIQIVAVDRSPGAVEVARENAARLAIPNVCFQVSDWYSALVKDRFDLILCNPPYVAGNDEHLRGEIRYEPREALVAGAGGLADLRRIIASSPRFLMPDGHLLLEHGHQQALEVQGMLQRAGFHRVKSTPDLAGLPRVTGGQLVNP